MLTISIDELEHMEDPIAALVWKQWIRQGKARLLETQGFGKKFSEKEIDSSAGFLISTFSNNF